MKITALILAKSQSNRLPNKNTLDFHGQPMFLVNVKKCLDIFDKVYVSSDSLYILNLALEAGAIPIKRPKELCGDTPNIPVYQHAMKQMDCDAFVAVQANSPNVSPEIIRKAKSFLEEGDQFITKDDSIPYKIYGSVWGMTRERLEKYKPPYFYKEEDYETCFLMTDLSIDIHTQEDYERCLNNN